MKNLCQCRRHPGRDLKGTPMDYNCRVNLGRYTRLFFPLKTTVREEIGVRTYVCKCKEAAVNCFLFQNNFLFWILGDGHTRQY